MRVLILFLLLSPIQSFSQGIMKAQYNCLFLNNTAYYFSASGNDSNDGLSPSHPITPNKIPSLPLIEGDTLLFNKGDSFVIGGITATCNYVVLKSYGSGSMPKFYGSSDLSTASWTDNGDGTWYTPLVTSPLWVYINGSSARNAESAPVTVTAHTSNSLTGSQVALDAWNSTQSLIGSKVRWTEFNWVSSIEYTITGYSAGVLTVSGGPITATGAVNIPCQMYLYQQKQWMTNANDWFYDAAAQRLYIKSTVSPTTLTIRQGIYDGVFASYKRLSVMGIEFTQYNQSIDISNSNNSIFTNNYVHDCRNAGFFGSNINNVTLTNNIFDKIDNNGVALLYETNSTITGNTIGNIDQGLSRGRKDLTGSPSYTQGSFVNGFGIVVLHTLRCNISNNEIHHTSGGATQVEVGSNYTFNQNYIHDFGNWYTDNGGVYVFGASGATISNGSITNNIIYNPSTTARGTSTNAGIYLDGNIDGGTYDFSATVTNNSVANYSGIAFFANSGSNHIISNNNFLGSSLTTGNKGTVTFGTSFAGVGNTFTNNKVVCAINNGYAMGFQTAQNPFQGGGSCDNNQYVNPYSTVIVSYNGSNKTLAQWQSVYSLDASSTSRSNYITYSSTTNAAHECNIELNYANSVESFNTPTGYSDCQANPFTNPVSIPAYFSLIYLKNTSYP